MQISPELEEAAYAGGLSLLRVFQKILIPLLKPSLLYAWLWMALLSYRERQVAFELPGRLEYVELSGRTDFNDTFVSVLQFPHLEPVG